MAAALPWRLPRQLCWYSISDGLQSRTTETAIVEKPAEEAADAGQGHHGHAHQFVSRE